MERRREWQQQLAEEERKSESGTSAKRGGDGLVSRGSIEGGGDILDTNK